jgi:DNA-directed RNA polymerase specialized sigma subunit
LKSQDDHFKKFASWLEREIAKYGEANVDYYERQKAQVEKLVALESAFRKELISHRSGASVYRDFITFICDERRNILAARPYFRERQTVFTKQISKALKKRAEKSLYRFHFNFQFVQFVVGARSWGKIGRRILELAEAIKAIRTELVEMNMPLAISRARIFWSRTPKSHLSLMDLIQISAEGLMSAVDKFVPPFSRVFRAVAIGRMTGNFIEEYSETPIHFYPCDKRKIYRANKLTGRQPDSIDFERLASDVNAMARRSGEAPHRTDARELAGLMAAASVVSADSNSSQDPDAPEPIARFAAPESSRPDRQVEERDAITRMAWAVAQLTVYEQKVLRLKGVSLDGVHFAT